MKRTFKSAVSVLLLAAFVMSLMPVISFASAETHPGMLDDSISFKPSSAKSGWQRYDVIDSEYLGGKGEPYSLWGDSAGAPRREISVASAGGAQDVVEMSVYIPSNSQGMSFELAVHKYPVPESGTKYSTLPLLVKNDGIYSNFSAGPKKLCTIDGADKWINLAFVSPEPYVDSAASNSNALNIYVNGVLKKSQGVIYSKSGFRHLRLSAIGGTSALDPVMYVDNVRIYSGEYAPEYDLVDNIAYTGGIDENTLFIKDTVTVAQLKEGITKKEDTTIRVYESVTSTNPLGDDEIVKEGYTVVAAAKNGADMERSYNYYTVAKYVKNYPDINDGSNTGLNALKKKTGATGTQTFETPTGNFGGKENDQYILWCDSDGTYTRQIPLNCSGGQDTLEMSFLIPSGSNGFSIGQHISNTAGTGATGVTLWFKPTGIYAGWYESTASKIFSLETDKWYSFALVTPTPYSDGSEPGVDKTILYLNGESQSVTTNNTKTGFRYLNVKCAANGSLVPAIYLDNIRTHSDTYEPQYDLIDEISYIGGIQDGTLLTNGELTVGELKSGITKKEDTVIRVYESSAFTQPLSDDTPVKDDYIVVAAAKNGSEMERSYSYYRTGKYIHRYPGINAGTTVFKPTSTMSAYQRMESVNGFLGGKGGEDYLLLADSSGAPQRELLLTDATGKQDVLEMSVYVPSGSKGISLSLYFTNLENKPTSLPLLIREDGLYTNFSAGPSRFCKLEPDRWNTIAIVSPEPYVDSAAENSMAVKTYINGELADTRNVAYTKSGFRNKIFVTSYSDKGTSEPQIYFDNIRIHSLGYDAEYDALDKIEYKDGIDDNNNIIVKGATTVAQLKADITKKEDTAIRVYSSISSLQPLSDGATVEDGYVVVAAAKNGAEMERSYNYYTIDKIKYEKNSETLVNGVSSNVYDGDDELLVKNEFINYTSDVSYDLTMYSAQYVNGKLVNLWSDPQTVNPGETKTFTCDFADMKDRESSNIKVMLTDGTLNLYGAPLNMHYNRENTKATLYLMGDSIVQTYVDVGYPIQGWGYFLGEYLNDNITVENRATSGWTTDHYLYPDGVYTKKDGILPLGTELLNSKGAKKTVGESNRYKTWESIKSTLKPGDFVMMALGINDAGSGNVSEERYVENIETVYSEATSIGATVILMTPSITGRDWNDTAGFRQEYIGRGKLCQEIAARHNGICLSFGAELIKTYDEMFNAYMEENPDATTVEGKNYVRNYFHLYGASSTNPPPGWDDFGSKTTDDDMHYNFVGANKAASVIAKLLAESDSPLGDYVLATQ